MSFIRLHHRHRKKRIWPTVSTSMPQHQKRRLKKSLLQRRLDVFLEVSDRAKIDSFFLTEKPTRVHFILAHQCLVYPAPAHLQAKTEPETDEARRNKYLKGKFLKVKDTSDPQLQVFRKVYSLQECPQSCKSCHSLIRQILISGCTQAPGLTACPTDNKLPV